MQLGVVLVFFSTAIYNITMRLDYPDQKKCHRGLWFGLGPFLDESHIRHGATLKENMVIEISKLSNIINFIMKFRLHLYISNIFPNSFFPSAVRVALNGNF